MGNDISGYEDILGDSKTNPSPQQNLSNDNSGYEDILGSNKTPNFNTVLKDTVGSVNPPQENIFQKIARGAQDFGNESMNQAKQLGYGFTDEATLGAPTIAKEFTGINMDPGEPKNIMQQVARGAGRVGGFAFGGPEILADKAAGKIANPFLKGISKGGISMASLTPKGLISGESDPSTEATRVGLGAATGGLFGLGEGIGNALYKHGFEKNIAKAHADDINSELGKIKDSIKNNPNANVDATNLWVKLRNIYDNLGKPIQDEVPEIKAWIDHIENNGGNVHADQIRQMESQLGGVAKFKSQKNGFMQMLGGKPPVPVVNEALQGARTAASDEYDSVASNLGHPEFGPKSRELSGILKKNPDMDPSKKSSGAFMDAITALAAHQALPEPFKTIGGLGTYLAERAARNPGMRQKAFEFLSDPNTQNILEKAGNISRGATSETTRSLATKKQ